MSRDPVTIASLESVTPLPTIRRVLHEPLRRAVEQARRAAALEALEAALDPVNAITLAVDAHGVVILRHPTRGTYRGGSLVEVALAFDRGVRHGA